MARKKKERGEVGKPKIKYYSEPNTLQRYMGFPTIEEQEKEERKKEIYSGLIKDLRKTFNKPLISKSRKTTKTKGKPLYVSAQRGMGGFFRTGLYR